MLFVEKLQKLIKLW